MIGSPCYMAPEQLHQLEYTNSVDVWALGICVIELAEETLQYAHLQPVRAMQKIK
jgi:serine/threonine protein kinase